MAEAAREFDTRELNSVSDSDKRFQLWVYLFVLLVVVGLAVFIVARDWRAISSKSPAGLLALSYDLAVWLICTLVAYAIIDAALDLRRGASVVRVTDEGVELNYPGKQAAQVPWNESSTVVTLFEWPNLPNQGYALRIGRVNTRIPLEARDVILHRAEQMEMQIDVRTAFAFSSAFRPRVTRIRPRISTPRLSDPAAGRHTDRS
jgi:hypothetical protein